MAMTLNAQWKEQFTNNTIPAKQQSLMRGRRANLRLRSAASSAGHFANENSFGFSREASVTGTPALEQSSDVRETEAVPTLATAAWLAASPLNEAGWSGSAIIAAVDDDEDEDEDLDDEDDDLDDEDEDLDADEEEDFDEDDEDEEEDEEEGYDEDEDLDDEDEDEDDE